MNNQICLELLITPEFDQQRLDQALATLCGQYSRSLIQSWIKQGYVSVNGKIELKPKAKVSNGQAIFIQAHLASNETLIEEDIPLNIIYEDDDLIVINKPPGLVVHPGAGNLQHTLVNALLHHDPNLRSLPRAGLVHRLDKQTSGLLVIARHLAAHHFLVKNMQQRHIKREYVAIVDGRVACGGVIKTLIGRHPTHRTKMSVVTKGKPAVTHYRVIQTFRAHSYLHIQLETGRTHQIRVHMAHIHHPIVGDPEYGAKRPQSFHRQALHAIQLTLEHPRSGQTLSWQSPLPEDIQQLLLQLQEESNDHP